MITKNKTKEPKILVVSNNSFSLSSNNGKTIASFFNRYPIENIAQLYFNSEIPVNTPFKNYYRITDFDVLKSLLSNTEYCGRKIETTKENDQTSLKESTSRLSPIIKSNSISRMGREIVWKLGKWNTKGLDNWISDFSPDVIFLCAGDSLFSYDITKYIKNKFESKLVIYITDDYVLPRRTISPFWWIRRSMILKEMKSSVQQSDLFVTISKEMQNVYKDLFNKRSILAVNMTESMKDDCSTPGFNNDLILVYTGGLHYKRYLTLNLLALALKKYNGESKNKRKAYLKVYSGDQLNKKVAKYINIEGASEFCGNLDQVKLRNTLNECDIPVHVESFKRKSMESTRLSISTKIPEYLSLGKPILAIGPESLASIRYLKDTALCVTKSDNIYNELVMLLNETELRKDIARKSLLKYNMNHRTDEVSDRFMLEINNLFKH